MRTRHAQRLAERLLRAAVQLAILVLAACATPRIERQQLPFVSPVVEVAPGASYETCVNLEAADRFYFTYKADPPMSFSIRRQTGPAVVSYLVRDASPDESGVFAVPQPADYCLHWEPSVFDTPYPTLLRFEVKLTGTP